MNQNVIYEILHDKIKTVPDSTAVKADYKVMPVIMKEGVA